MLEGPESLKSAHKFVLPENVSVSAFYTTNMGEMDPKVAKLAYLPQIWTYRPLTSPIIYQRVMLAGSESPKSPHKLVLPENVSISTFYTVILGEMDPKVAKLVNLTQNWTFRPLIRPVKYQRVMLEGPESPKSAHKSVLPENVSISAFYTVHMGVMDPKMAKLVNLAQIWTCNPHNKVHNSLMGYVRGPKISQKVP